MNYELCDDCRLKAIRQEYDQTQSQRRKDQFASLDFESALTLDCPSDKEGCAQLYVDWLNAYPTLGQDRKTFTVKELKEIELDRQKVAKSWGW